jgi:hypothetical protein
MRKRWTGETASTTLYSTIIRLKRKVEDGKEDRMKDIMKDRWLKKKV